MKWKLGSMGFALVFCATGLWAQEPAKPNVDAVVEQIAAIGPDALVARVKELKAAEGKLKQDATGLRKQADAKDKEAAAMRTRIAAVEKFLTDLNTAMNPKPPAPAATPAAAPAPAPAAAKPAPAAAPAPAPAKPAPAATPPPAAAAPAPAATPAPAPAAAPPK